MTVQQNSHTNTNLPTNDSIAVEFDHKPLLLLNKQRKIMTKNWQIQNSGLVVDMR